MNASAPTLDVVEAAQFLQFWVEVTGISHVTLVAITPDGPTDTRSFRRGAGNVMGDWITSAQQAGRNIYFQPNETFPECCSKPSKREMMAGLCRFADIDPAADQPLADERDRLSRLVAHLIADAAFPPTCVIDSGNGTQPLWATVREVLSPQIIARIERETAAIEAAIGAGGTHDVTRLLRLPGTINFPNAAKRAKGRSTTRARLIHSASNIYTGEQIAGLAAHLSTVLRDTGLVRLRHRAEAGSSPERDAATAALIKELEAAGADSISKPEHLETALWTRLEGSMKTRPRLADRWAGMVEDLTEAGRDSSRSAADLSLAAMLKAARFTHVEVGLILCACPHSKANADDWASSALRLRDVARCVIRSHEPRPEAARAEANRHGTDEDAAIVWSTPLDFLADPDIPAPVLTEEHVPDAIYGMAQDAANRMGVDTASVAVSAVTSCAAVISDEWIVRPKRFDTEWDECARLWTLILGDPSILKSPVITLCTRPIDRLEQQARSLHKLQVARNTSKISQRGNRPATTLYQNREDRNWLDTWSRIRQPKRFQRFFEATTAAVSTPHVARYWSARTR